MITHAFAFRFYLALGQNLISPFLVIIARRSDDCYAAFLLTNRNFQITNNMSVSLSNLKNATDDAF